MKFVASSKALLCQLERVAKAMPKDSRLPILSCFLFDVQKGQLTITATDLRNTLTASLHIEHKESGRFCVERHLLDLLKLMPEQPITLTWQRQCPVEVRHETGMFKIDTYQADDFPKLPILPDAGVEWEMILPGSALLHILQRAVSMCSKDELRPALTGVCVNMSIGSLDVVGTDAKRLIVCTLKDESINRVAKIILSPSSVKMLQDLMVDHDYAIRIRKSKSVPVYAFDTVTVLKEGELSSPTSYLLTTPIDARYPDYHAVIPPKPGRTTQPVFNRMDLIFCLQRLAVLAKEVDLSLLEGLATLRDDLGGTITETIPYDTANGIAPATTAIDPNLLLSMLSNMPASVEHVRMEISQPQQAIVVVDADADADDSSELYLLAPCMPRA